MPNWCENIVTFSHDNPVQITRVAEAWNNNELLNTFFPCPEELVETMSGSHSNKADSRIHARQQKRNVEKYGYANWYGWRLEQWGTKWDVGRRDQNPVDLPTKDTKITLSFSSAWAPPINFYAKMETLGFTIDAKYCELGVGFVGEWINGLDREYSTANLSDIPKHLREAFNLDEQLADEEDEP